MHNFCLLNIKRPVLSSVFSLLLVVFGLYTFFQISTRELPKDLQPPVVEIRTNYTGASPSIISSEISEPIELAVGGAEGIKSIDTLSEIGRSTIKIEFFTNIFAEVLFYFCWFTIRMLHYVMFFFVLCVSSHLRWS